MKTDLTKCAHCGQILVHHEDIHAVKGEMFCSKDCAVNSIMNDYITHARELALEAYASEAEVVSSEDVLKEDLQDVRISVKCIKVVKLPANMSEEEAVSAACSMYNEGIVVVDTDDCDDLTVTYELVKDDNSSCR